MASSSSDKKFADKHDPVLPRKDPDDTAETSSHPLAVSGPPDKLTEAPIAALQDPDLLPTTTSKPRLQQARSFTFLVIIVASGVGAGWFAGLDILQGESLTEVSAKGGLLCILAVLGVLMTGGQEIDWFELVLGWWWVAMPIYTMAGLTIVMAQERTQGLQEVT